MNNAFLISNRQEKAVCFPCNDLDYYMINLDFGIHFFLAAHNYKWAAYN